ncbi:MAG: hypothetical protein QW727_04320 [Candidatus Pacearchaeota archaeon]
MRNKRYVREYKSFLPEIINSKFEMFYEDVKKSLYMMENELDNENKNLDINEAIKRRSRLRFRKKFVNEEKIFLNQLFTTAFLNAIETLNKDELLAENHQLHLQLYSLHLLTRKSKFYKLIKYLSDVYIDHPEKCSCKLCLTITSLILDKNDDMFIESII